MDFTFTEQEINIIVNALAQRPYGEVASVIATIQGQLQKNEFKTD